MWAARLIVTLGGIKRMKHTRAPTAGRIRQAREVAGLGPSALAESLGLPSQSYEDLEAYDDEAFMCISLGQLRTLAAILNVTARGLIAPEGVDGVRGEVTAAEVVDAIRERLRRSEQTVEDFEAEVGWSIAGALNNPDSIWSDWNLDGLQDICRAIGLEWLRVVPERKGLHSAGPVEVS